MLAGSVLAMVFFGNLAAMATLAVVPWQLALWRGMLPLSTDAEAEQIVLQD